MKNWLRHLKHGLNKKLPLDNRIGQGRPLNLKSNLRNLKPILARHWPEAALGGVLLVALCPFEYLSPILYGFLIDTVILGKKVNLFIPVICILVLMKIIEKLGGIIQNFYFTRFSRQMVLDIQHDLLDRVFAFPKSFFDDKETGYLMSRISNDVANLQWFFSGTLFFAATSVLKFATGTALLFYLEWRLAVFSLVILPTFVFGVRYFSARTRILSHHYMESQARISNRLQEALSALPMIKAFATEKHETDRIMKEMTNSYHLTLEQTAVQSLAGLAIGSLADLARLVVLVVGAALVMWGKWTLGSLYAFNTYLSYVFSPAQSLANINLQLQSALAALERVSALYAILPEESGSGHIIVEHLQGKIEFRDISFSYDGKENVLDNVSFSIQKGEHVAIVGPSGVGKTTLISLMLGFYWPTRGNILFDGIPFSDFKLDSLRRQIGYVSQSTRLLTGTIMENLCYGNPGAGEETVIAKAKAAGIHDFIDSLPDKYHSLLGENGVNLSEGQRQRLSIARALVKDPDILILDEPSSSLDSLAEKSIFENLPKVLLDKTLIVVAHRLSTIKDADRILVFNEKRLVAEGTHAMLSKENEFYRCLMLSSAEGNNPLDSPTHL